MYEGNLLHYADKSACHFKSFAILLFCVAYLIYLAMSCFFGSVESYLLSEIG